MSKERNNLHHVYLLVGDSRRAFAVLDKFFQGSFKLRGNPDFFVLEQEVIGIAEARGLHERAIQKAFGERKVFLILGSKYTMEAQNALLKILEDPPSNTYFFLTVREGAQIIPTLLSRMEMFQIEPLGEIKDETEGFLGLSVLERLNFAKEFVEKEKDLAAFLDSLLLVLRRKKAPLDEAGKIFEVRKFALDRSASSRLILEHLALVVSRQ